MSRMTINGWKQIATHLEISVRTAQRWERDAGLPVHRLIAPGGVVHAHPEELDAWLLGPGPHASGPASAPTTSTPIVAAATEALSAAVPGSHTSVGFGRSTVRAFELALIMLMR